MARSASHSLPRETDRDIDKGAHSNDTKGSEHHVGGTSATAQSRIHQCQTGARERHKQNQNKDCCFI